MGPATSSQPRKIRPSRDSRRFTLRFRPVRPALPARGENPGKPAKSALRPVRPALSHAPARALWVHAIPVPGWPWRSDKTWLRRTRITPAAYTNAPSLPPRIHPDRPETQQQSMGCGRIDDAIARVTTTPCGVRPMSIGRCGPVAFQLRSWQGPDLQWRNGAARGADLNTEGTEDTEFRGETKGTQPWWCHDRWWRFRMCSCCSFSVSLSRHHLLPERQGP